ncbi:hypothetical protein VKT23_011690 [Stygiomarasmius scandens]|uniref:CCHC-type domain-containing protein n=1 Tax=Marasmiellus scandens TaxID=2682957 RepID=A0ABR1JB58_9AGAR
MPFPTAASPSTSPASPPSSGYPPRNNVHSAPQCCHCGWRGAHAPNCPFKA